MNPFRQAKQLSDLLARSGVRHWLEYGSLLGAVRTGQAILWDHDIDFGCIQQDCAKLLGLGREARKLGLQLQELPDHLIRFQPASSSSHRIRWIDFYPCSKQGSTLIPGPVPGSRFRYLHVDELEEIAFEGFHFPCPRYSEKLLALRYGDTWNVPIRQGWERINEPGAGSGPDFVNEGTDEGPITGYTEGVFDLFHFGHVELLRRGKELFDRFVVGVNSDATARAYKRQPVVAYQNRLEMVRACKYADAVIEDAPLATTLNFMRRHGLDYVLHGRAPTRWLEQFYSEPRAAGKLHLIARTPGIDTTSLIRRISRKRLTGDRDGHARTKPLRRPC